MDQKSPICLGDPKMTAISLPVPQCLLKKCEDQLPSSDRSTCLPAISQATKSNMAIFEKAVVGGIFLERLSLDPLRVHDSEKPPRGGIGIVGLQRRVGEYNVNIVNFITHRVGIIITCSEIR